MFGKKKANHNDFITNSMSNVNKQILLMQKVLTQVTSTIKLWAEKTKSHDTLIKQLSSDLKTLSNKVHSPEDSQYNMHIKKLVAMNNDLMKVIDEEKHLGKEIIPTIEKKIHDITNEIRMNYHNIKDIQISVKHMELKHKSLEKSIISLNPQTNSFVKYRDIKDINSKLVDLANMNKRLVKLVNVSGTNNLQIKIENEINKLKEISQSNTKRIFQIEQFDDDELRVLVSDLEKTMKDNKERVDIIEDSSHNVERELSSILKMNAKFVSLLNRKEQMEYKSLKISAGEAKRLSELVRDTKSRLDTIESMNLKIQPQLLDKMNEMKSHINNLKKLQPSADINQQLRTLNNRISSIESKTNRPDPVISKYSPELSPEELKDIIRTKDEMHSMMEKTRTFVSLVSKREALSMKSDEDLKAKEMQLNDLIDSMTKLIEQTEKKKEKLEIMINQGQQVFSILKKKERRTESELDVQLDAILSKI